MSYRPTYEDPEYYDDADAEEGDWQDMEDARGRCLRSLWSR
jgi:hypothetical protein